MKSIMKRLSVFFMVIMLTFSTCMTAFAADNSGAGKLGEVLDKIESYKDTDDTSKKKAYESALQTWESVQSSGDGEVEATLGGVTKRFTNTATDATSDTADANYISAYTEMNKSLNNIVGTSNDVRTAKGARTDLQAVVDTMNSQAAVDEAADGLSSVMPLVNQFTGMIVIVTLLGLAIFTSLDVAYLVFPVAKQQMDAAGQSGRASVSKTDKATGEAKFRWVSDDAIGAYQQGTESGKNPLFVYLKKRLISYIAVAIVIYMLMSGNISVIINFVLQMLESFFNMLSSLSIN